MLILGFIKSAMKNLKQQFLEGLFLTTFRHEAQSSKSVRICSDSIPVDILIEIFSRVPGKSIARFRCVSKFWASILRRSDFTELFLTKSLTRPRLLFTVQTDGKLFFYSTPQAQNPNENSSLVATPYHDMSIPEYYPTYICKPVCGLVLLQGHGRRHGRLICNPTKGKVLTLPKVPRKGTQYSPRGIYLGYDPIGKQFKVLCVNTSLNGIRPDTHWILTFESGKRLWRTIEHRFQFEDTDRIDGDICINGVLYFGGGFECYSGIVCFDVRSEKFGFIKKDKDMPPEPFDSSSSLTLFNYKGKLGIHHHPDREGLVLWVLEDAGNHIWSKHSIYVLPSLGNQIVVEKSFVGMTRSGEIVLASNTYPCDVFFYNLESNTFTRVKIQRCEELEHYRPVLKTYIDYVENLKFM